MGLSNVNINVTATIKWGNSRLRVALVLDNTGSMAQSGKITALKTATNSLLTQLQTAASQKWRRLRFDHSLRQGRQCRPGQLQSDLDRLDRLG